MRKPNNRGFWRHKVTGKTYPDERENCEYWDSYLELKVYQRLSSEINDPILRQWRMPLIDGCYGLPTATWTTDFVIPSKRLVVEAKGTWINNRSASAEKAKFLLQVRLAVHQGWHVIVVNDKAFKVGSLQVHNCMNVDWSDPTKIFQRK